MGAIATVGVGLALGAGDASGAVFQVDTTGEGADAVPGDGHCQSAAGRCTVRAAIGEANALGGLDEIRVPAGTYPVTEARLEITDSLRLIAPAGARRTTLTAGPALDRLLFVGGGGAVTIDGLAITGVTGNGPPIDIDGADTALRGIWVHDNETYGPGGGIRIAASNTTIAQSSVTGNRLITAFGQPHGGGIYISGGASATIVATTVANNTIDDDATPSFGGGIAVIGGTATLRHVTLHGNATESGNSAGGNLYVGAPATLSDSIVAAGAAAFGPDCYSADPTLLTAAGRNIYPNGTLDNCALPPATVAAGATATTLLADHGGTGLSLLPTLPSAALNAAASCPDSGRDQRGALAPAGPACDIGATELGADLRVTLSPTPTTALPGARVKLVARVSNAGLDSAPAVRLTLPAPTRTLSPRRPSAGTCDGAACSLGSLAAGQSATVETAVAMPKRGALTATATAASPVPDPTPADALATVTVRRDTTPGPAITKLRPKGKLRARRGGKLRARLSAAGTVRIGVARIVKGRRAKGRCRPAARRGKRCQILRKLGTVRAKRRAGAIVVRLPGRIGRKPLTAGRYRLTAVAVDAAGRRSAKPATATVRVHRAAKRKRKR